MKNVFFKPWVGENYYSKGFNGKRILVLGESCYCGVCDCSGLEDWTIDNSFPNRWGDGLRYYNNGIRNIPAYACYHPSPRTGFSTEDTDRFKSFLEKISCTSK